MKRVFLFLTGVLLLSMSFSSCKKCYDCVYETQTTVNNNTITSRYEEEICGKKVDIEAYEIVGYKCQAKK